MIKTRCAICGNYDHSKLLYKEKLPPKVSAKEYAPRRERDGYHYQMVKCQTCGLVRSDPIKASKELAHLYEESECTYSACNENQPLKQTYGYYLERLLKRYGANKGTLLDIGCANGFFLEKALELGFKKIAGVEPSVSAIQRAGSRMRSKIRVGMFKKGIFSKESFDVVCFFQTLDHISDPNAFLKDCFDILKPEGFILAINHNIGAISAKILHEKSPIIDIGHAYLYDLQTMRKIFEKNGFLVKEVFSVKNRLTLEYLIHLLPMRPKLRSIFKRVAKALGINNLTLGLHIGNLGIYAQKPR